MNISYSIMNEYINSHYRSIQTLKNLAIKYYKNNYLLEIIMGIYEDNITKVLQISSYNNFEIIERVVESNNIGLWTGGIKTKECFDFSYNELIKSRAISSIYQNTFDYLSYEGIGGLLSVYKLNKTGCKLFYQNNIFEKSINRFISNINNKHLVYAERLIGQIVASVNLIVTNTAGNVTINDLGMTVEDMDLTITKSDNSARILENATNGLLLQKNVGTTGTPVWENTLSMGIGSGSLSITGDFTMTKGSIVVDGDTLLDATNKIFNISNFNTIAGVINAENINLKGLSMFNALGEETLYITSGGDITMQGTLNSTIIKAGQILGTTGASGAAILYIGENGGSIDTTTDEGTGYQAFRLKPGVTVTGANAGYVQFLEDGHIYFYNNDGSGASFAQINPDGTTNLISSSGGGDAGGIVFIEFVD